ncbi:MAG: DUF4864 domain-containing protein [Pseudomonadota bacterium]
MRGLAFGIVLALFAGPLSAQSNGERIEAVISSQFAAFQDDDVATAFTFASPMIQSIFGSAERFGQMVRSGYPMVWRPKDVSFTCLTERNGQYFQSVRITDAAGTAHSLDYEMIETEAGWLINGVFFRPPSCLGA